MHNWQFLSVQFIHRVLKDTPLLGCVGLQYPCRDHSFYLGTSILRSFDISRFTRRHWLFPSVMWTTSLSADYLAQGEYLTTSWSHVLTLTSLTASMVVNALSTGLIVFRIYKVFRPVKDNTTSDEKFLGLTGGRKLRSIIFIIIESGMALFAIQLAGLILNAMDSMNGNLNVAAAYNVITNIQEMINVTISSVVVTLRFLTMWTWLGYNTYHHPGEGVNRNVFRRWDIFHGSCW